MKLKVKWHAPVPLKDGRKERLIYTIEDRDRWDGLAGVYMFCRQFGGATIPLYIGRADDISKRLKQHLLNNTRLMNGIKDSSSGKKVFVAGEFQPKQGQKIKSAIAIIERALIKHALSENCVLLNYQGTRTPTHEIDFSGYLGARKFTGTAMKSAVSGR